MSKKTTLQTVGEIAFPMILYYLLNMVLPSVLSMFWEGFLQEEQAMWLLTATNCCLIPVFVWIYRRDRLREESLFLEQGDKPRKRTKYGLREMALVFLGAVCISRGLNLFLGMTFLPRHFTGYEEAQAQMFRCSLLSQVMASAVSAPILEELLMRGLVYGRIRAAFSSSRAAVFLSALIFGLFHGNVVQGIYAFGLGLFFAQVYESYGSLIPAMVAHSAANGATFLAVTLPFQGQGAKGAAVYEFAAALFLLAGAFCWRKILRFSGAQK